MNDPKRFPGEPILLVDDEPSWLHSLAFTLEYTGGFNHLLTCSDSRNAIGLLRCQPVSLVLLDLVMPHVGGEDLLAQIAQEYPELPVIVLSGLNQLETAVRCMKCGAFDYYVKTSEPERLLAGIRRALELRTLQRENRELRAHLLRRELRHPDVFAAFITRSPKMEAVFGYIEAIASSPEPVLITGEGGTGKELAARALHRLSSPDGPWVDIAATALDERRGLAMLLGEGGEPGLLARARGGVLFIDEIGDLPPTVQAKLAEWLQQGEYLPTGAQAPQRLDLRLIAASRVSPQQLVDECRFRKDLLYRLGVHQVHLPPLRERLEDLPLLLDQLLLEACAARGRHKPLVPRNLPALLATHPFPGNLRELRTLVTAAVAANPPRGRLSLEPFRRHVAAAAAQEPAAAVAHDTPLLVVPGRFPTLAEARDQVIQEALRRANGNQTIAARLLGISQPALSIHLKKAGPLPSS